MIFLIEIYFQLNREKIFIDGIAGRDSQVEYFNAKAGYIDHSLSHHYTIKIIQGTYNEKQSNYLAMCLLVIMIWEFAPPLNE